jgi:hypothetical protein
MATEQDGTDADTGSGSREEPVAAPLLRVVRGEPTAEELAALVAVLSSVGSPAPPPARRTPDWNAPRRLHRTTHPHGPGGWRSSSLPR